MFCSLTVINIQFQTRFSLWWKRKKLIILQLICIEFHSHLGKYVLRIKTNWFQVRFKYTGMTFCEARLPHFTCNSNNPFTVSHRCMYVYLMTGWHAAFITSMNNLLFSLNKVIPHMSRDLIHVGYRNTLLSSYSSVASNTSGPVFCLLLRVSSGCARPITGQVTLVTWPVIGWA